jgi:2-polyprenyl-3-methyl-5-hydroxy-6-metoxy-1,4-benzoquinol methylase
MITTPNQFGTFYNEKRATADLRRYREKGPNPWTRTLIEALMAEGVAGSTLLDIGGGVGAIEHELLDAGAAHATSIEASAAYLDVARAEAERRGHSDRAELRHGDFIELAASIPPADIVTLDRVVNVYPDWERLVALSAERAQHLYGLVFPRDTRQVRLGVVAINLIFRGPVRAAVRPVDAIERILGEQGLRPHFTRTVGPVWQVAVYRRP